MTTRPDFPTTLPGPTGPLPRGWHRITWQRTDHIAEAGVYHLVSSDIESVVMLQVSLRLDPNVVPESVTVEAWSEFPPTIRPEYQS